MTIANSAAKTEVLNRLRTVRGHIAGIERMIEAEQSCGNILIQLSAVRSSKKSAFLF